jgi:hypothetical protein
MGHHDLPVLSSVPDHPIPFSVSAAPADPMFFFNCFSLMALHQLSEPYPLTGIRSCRM